MAAGASFLTESELHGLVDGHVETDRRADVLRRLAASAPDRALVEAWQEQADLIRAAFRDIERESLPVALDLAPPRLRCIDAGLPHAMEPLHDPVEPRRGGIAAAATVLVVAAGLVGAWLMMAQTARDGGAADVASQQTPLDATLADRAAAAVADGAVASKGEVASDNGLPTVRIPDLTTAGFMLTSVSTQPTEPVSLVLRYSDGGDGRLAVSIARMPQDLAPAAPTAVGKSIAWRRRDAAFAIAGTLPADRLRAIAASLQDDPSD